MTDFSPFEFIARKQAGEAHSPDELHRFIELFMAGEVDDYQMTAWMMAVYFKGMTDDEAAALTEAMIASGKRIRFQPKPFALGDKHSTGGVGDKITLMLAPLVAAAGMGVPTISGRGLGFTGGTLDKLESIPGFRTNLTIDELTRQVAEIGVAFGAQTTELVPADKRMYALRDVTSTIRSYPLITSSIISKKAAEGIDAIVYDVKCGRGAFMQSYDEALELARWLVRVSSTFGLKAAALITDMNTPLGRAVGNWLEVDECLRALRNEVIEPDLRELTLALGGTLLSLTGAAGTPHDGWKKLDMLWTSGEGFRRFHKAVAAQGGDVQALKAGAEPHTAGASLTLEAGAAGAIFAIDAREIGFAGVELRAGRKRQEDSIDPAAGMRFHRQVGDEVEANSPVVTLFGESEELCRNVARRVRAAIRIEDVPPNDTPLILKTVTATGEMDWAEFRHSTP